MKYKSISLKVIRILLGGVFLLSGIGKLMDSGYVNYDPIRLLSTKYFWLIEYAAPIVITISVIELILAVFLLWGKYLKWALSGALLMLAGFTTVLSYFYFQGMSVKSCGCFGAFGFSSGLEFTLVRNIVLGLLVVGAFILLTSQKTTNRTEPVAKE